MTKRKNAEREPAGEPGQARQAGKAGKVRYRCNKDKEIYTEASL